MTPNVLTIAGFDPSGGAGILADIKTFEFCKCKGFAVQTCNTIQTEDAFFTVNWVAEDLVLGQLHCLMSAYRFVGIKIGMMPSIPFLGKLLGVIKDLQPQAKVIWDPIAVTSSGFQVHTHFEELAPLLSSLFMITPNRDEMHYLSKDHNLGEALNMLSQQTHVLLKGGHNSEQLGVDVLAYKGESRKFNPKKGNYFPKHGSGCVFSAALLCYISKGFPLQKSILKSKRYIERFLSSSEGLLGTHYR